MARPGGEAQLDVAELLAHGALRTTKPMYVTPTSAPVTAVVIVTQLDSIARVAPNTVVVLSADLGSRGWLVSAALRLAWERRASAVVVAGSSYSSSVTGLAERLGITLLAADQDPASVALELAAALGAAKSVVNAQLARFARSVARESATQGVLTAISAELDGDRVALEQEEVVLVSAGATSGDTREIAVPMRGLGDVRPARLTARVSTATLHRAEIARGILEVAAPSLQAAFLLEEVQANANAVPTAALASLEAVTPHDVSAFASRYQHVLTQLGWRRDQQYIAVWIVHEPREAHSPQRTAVLRLLWRKVTARRSLAEVTDGWLAVIPASDTEDPAHLAARIMARIGSALRELSLSVGISSWQPEQPQIVSLVQEARLAAETARGPSAGTIAVFGDLDVAAATSFVDTAAILLIAELTLPELMAAKDRAPVVAAVTAFLDHQSAMTPAARALNVHRNTLQTRLNRARELKVPIDDSARLLSTHLILTVLKKTHPSESEHNHRKRKDAQ